MMTMRLRFLASSSGSAEMPSSSGISMSRTATSGLMRSSWLTASRPVRNEAATTISGSEPIQREINPLITTESSTSITRSGSCCIELGTTGLVNATLMLTNPTQRYSRPPTAHEPRGGSSSSDQADFLELGRDDILVERLHDVFVGASVKRARNVGDVVFGGAEHHLGLITTRHAAKVAEKFIAVHDRHIPIQQDSLRQPAPADFERFLAVFRFHDLEIQTFEDPPCDLSDDA